MAVNKVIFGGDTIIDLTADTLTSSDQLVTGATAHTKSGAPVTGSNPYEKAATDTAVSNALTELANKGVTLAGTESVADLATLIAELETGGGSGSGLNISNYDIFGGTFTPAEDVNSKLILATDDSLGLPSSHISKKKNFVCGAVWMTGGYTYTGTAYVSGAFSAPKNDQRNDSSSNRGRGAVIDDQNNAKQYVLMFNGSYAVDVSLTCTDSYKLKAGIEYAWVAFIPKE